MFASFTKTRLHSVLQCTTLCCVILFTYFICFVEELSLIFRTTSRAYLVNWSSLDSLRSLAYKVGVCF